MSLLQKKYRKKGRDLEPCLQHINPLKPNFLQSPKGIDKSSSMGRYFAFRTFVLLLNSSPSLLQFSRAPQEQSTSTPFLIKYNSSNFEDPVIENYESVVGRHYQIISNNHNIFPDRLRQQHQVQQKARCIYQTSWISQKEYRFPRT